MSKRKFVHPNRDQVLLLPPDLSEWVKEDHFARFLARLLESLDFTAFYEAYEGVHQSSSGRPPFSPDLMLGLIFYSMTKGVLSSRLMEELAYSDVGARYLTGNIQPDHSCIARFRARHTESMKGIFSQLVLLCHQAGLISLQNVALDSTVCVGNVGAGTTRSKDQLDEAWQRAKAKAQELLDKLEAADSEDKELQKRLKRQHSEAQGKADRIRQALDFIQARSSEASGESTPEGEVESSYDDQKAAIGQRIRDARLARSLTGAKLAEIVGSKRRAISDIERGKSPVSTSMVERLASELGLPADELRLSPRPKISKNRRHTRPHSINITDRDCYVTHKPGKGLRSGYLGQIAVDSKHQIVIDAHISKANSDQEYPVIFIEKCEERFGKGPDIATADSNYMSKRNIECFENHNVDAYLAVATDKGKSPNSDPRIRAMREKLEAPEGKKVYATRAGVVEPVFSRIASQLGFSRLLYRGLPKVTSEWFQVTTAYNLLRLYRLRG